MQHFARGLGGWGIPHLIAWLTQEAQDHLSTYISIIFSAVEICPDEYVSKMLSDLLLTTLDQELDQPGIIALLAAPTDVKAKGVISSFDP